jgi:DNA-binding MarR family transcriptional regulator
MDVKAMSSESERQKLLARLNDDFRQLSAGTILFHQAIADRLGMNITDHKCADILARTGPMTAGELARHTGLTTGAITGVIDRLEKKTFVRRVRDPHDRRRVIVQPVVKRMEKVIGPLFESIARSTTELCGSYSTEELALIHDFTVRVNQMTMKEVDKLRSGGASSTRAKVGKAT